MPTTTKTEDCRILTDRWGDLLDLDPPATAEQVADVQALLGSMVNEDCFIAERGGVRGVLLEIEYDDDKAPHETDATRMEQIQRSNPDVAAYFTQGGHVFNDRYAVRIFVPKAGATPERMDSLWSQLTEFLY